MLGVLRRRTILHPLAAAAERGHLAVVQRLLQLGAPPDHDRSVWAGVAQHTPLMLAAGERAPGASSLEGAEGTCSRVGWQPSSHLLCQLPIPNMWTPSCLPLAAASLLNPCPGSPFAVHSWRAPGRGGAPAAGGGLPHQD